MVDRKKIDQAWEGEETEGILCLACHILLIYYDINIILLLYCTVLLLYFEIVYLLYTVVVVEP